MVNGNGTGRRSKVEGPIILTPNSLANSSMDRHSFNSVAHSSTDRHSVFSLANSLTDRHSVNSLTNLLTDRHSVNLLVNSTVRRHCRRQSEKGRAYPLPSKFFINSYLLCLCGEGVKKRTLLLLCIRRLHTHHPHAPLTSNFSTMAREPA